MSNTKLDKSNVVPLKMDLFTATRLKPTYHAAFQMLRRRQNCKFCHIESRGKNDVTNLIKLQSTSFFLHMEPI